MTKYALDFVPDKLFLNKVGAYTNVLHSKDRLLSFPSIIPRTNTPAYFGVALEKKEIIYETLKPGDRKINLFRATFVIS